MAIDTAAVARELDAIKTCAPSEIHAHLSRALPDFRFVPKDERRSMAADFVAWADGLLTDSSARRATAYFVKAVDRFIVEEHSVALGLLSQARADYADASDSEGLGLCAMLIGAIYRTLGNYDLALKFLYEGHELLKASGRYPAFLAANANSMGNILLDTGKLDDALAMFRVTYDESARANDFYFMVYGLHGLGKVHIRMDRRVDAERNFRLALELAHQHSHPLQTSNALTELAALHCHAGELDDAERLSREALATREQHHLMGGAITNCIQLADIAGKRGRWADALPFLTHALSIAEELKVKPKIAQVHQQLSVVLEHTGDPAASLAHYKRFHALREEVEREDSARALADAKVVFDAEQTRKENAVIKAQKAEIEAKNEQLQQTIDELTRAKIGRKARAMTFALVLVLFVFQDFLLGSALRLLAGTHYNTYVVSLVLKMAIIFSLAPLNRAIERSLLRRVAFKT